MIISPRLQGTLFVLAAALCWSMAGLIVRHMESQGMPVVFARSAFMALAVGLYLLLIHRRNAVAVFAAAGKTGVISGLLLGASFVMFILAITHMPVANAYVLMCGSPLVSALLARLWLGEKLSPAILAAILLALLGIGVMFAEGMGQMTVAGTAFGLGVALAFGANVVLLRKKRHIDMVPSAFLGGLFSALVTLPLVELSAIPLADLPWLALLGFVQLGAGLILFVHGTRHLPSAEASLLTLGEAIMAPVWVWLFVSETPSFYTVTGGLIVLAAVIMQTFATQKAANRG
ncbi:MAG: DMT family transporter [Alphaproteobacteria bacterium]|nr:DMT family transporter [Alphaproteobacteria bacterium]